MEEHTNAMTTNTQTTELVLVNPQPHRRRATRPYTFRDCMTIFSVLAIASLLWGLMLAPIAIAIFNFVPVK